MPYLIFGFSLSSLQNNLTRHGLSERQYFPSCCRASGRLARQARGGHFHRKTGSRVSDCPDVGSHSAVPSEPSISPDFGDSPEPRINNPPVYSGEPTQCRSFLTQCEVVFSLQPSTYAKHRAKVAFVISLLAGQAREWGAANWEAEVDCVFDFSLFKEEMIRVFDRSAHGEEASHPLSTLRQERRSIADFSIEFRTLSTTCGWNEPALIARFLEALNPELKDEIFMRELPTRLDALIDLAIRVEKRFDLRRRARSNLCSRFPLPLPLHDPPIRTQNPCSSEGFASPPRSASDV